MKRTTITLPDELAELVSREARRRETSVSGLLRSFIESELHVRPGEARAIPWAGIFDDPSMAPATQLDEDLAEGWADDIDRDRR